MRSLSEPPGFFLPRIISALGSGWFIYLFFAALTLFALEGIDHGDTRFLWLAALAVLSWIAIRMEISTGFLLLGVSWVLGMKVPLPWAALEFVFVRADDLLVLLLLIKWAKSQAGNLGTYPENSRGHNPDLKSQIGLCPRIFGGVSPNFNPLARPILVFLAVSLASMNLGLWMHFIDKPWYTLFNLLKWCEYFLLFFLAFRMENPMKGLLALVVGMASAATVLQVFGFWEHFRPLAQVFVGNYYRLFERPPFLAQANHFGMFLVMVLSFALPLFIRLRRNAALLSLLAWSLGTSFVLFWTYSRMSYLALVLSFSVICLATRRMRVTLVAFFLVCTPVLSSSRVWERVSSLPGTLHGGEFTSSVIARIQRWDVLWDSVQKFPLLGTGIGSRERIFYESFWMQLLCETGIVGTVLFVGTMILGLSVLVRSLRAGKSSGNVIATQSETKGKQSRSLNGIASVAALPRNDFGTVRSGTDDLFGSWTISFLGIFAAMLLGAVTLVNFVITVLAAPFWCCFGFLLREAMLASGKRLGEMSSPNVLIGDPIQVDSR